MTLISNSEIILMWFAQLVLLGFLIGGFAAVLYIVLTKGGRKW